MEEIQNVSINLSEQGYYRVATILGQGNFTYSLYRQRSFKVLGETKIYGHSVMGTCYKKEKITIKN